MNITILFGAMLLIIGIWAMLTHKNLIRIIIGFSLMDTGIHVIMVSVGYIGGKTAPILDKAVDKASALTRVVDPIPSALVLTAIVIGLAVTALMLSYAVRMVHKGKSLSIDDYQESRW